MSTNNKKSFVNQALLEMDTIKSAIKEESKSTIKAMLNEAVKDALRESIDEDEYEIEDEDDKEAKKGTKKSVKEDGEEEMDPNAAQAEPAVEPEAGAEEAPAEEPAAEEPEAAEEGDMLDQYKVGDDTYDLTGENDYEKVAAVYKRLGPDDQVVIKKNSDGSIKLKDDAAGTEYVIDFGAEGEEAAPEAGAEEAPAEEPAAEAPAAEGEEETMPEDGEEDELNEGVFEIELPDEDEENMEFNNDEIAGQPLEGMQENKKSNKKTMKENKEVIFEVDLGYTDNYQDKDPIAGLSNEEPSKSGKSWHKGVPTGTEKPWAGKTQGKGDPFDKGVNEECEEACCKEEAEEPVEEGTNVGGAVQQRSMGAKNHVPANRKEHLPKPAHHISAEANYEAAVNENKELRKAVKELRNSLNEAYLVNVNLGKITKLFLENTTTLQEKIDIINRFNDEAKTVDQSKALYESINKELKKGPKAEQVIENNGKASAAKPLNEGKNYTQSKDVLEIIDFMNRMKNC